MDVIQWCDVGNVLEDHGYTFLNVTINNAYLFIMFSVWRVTLQRARGHHEDATNGPHHRLDGGWGRRAGAGAGRGRE